MVFGLFKKSDKKKWEPVVVDSKSPPQSRLDYLGRNSLSAVNNQPGLPEPVPTSDAAPGPPSPTSDANEMLRNSLIAAAKAQQIAMGGVIAAVGGDQLNHQEASKISAPEELLEQSEKLVNWQRTSQQRVWMANTSELARQQKMKQQARAEKEAYLERKRQEEAEKNAAELRTKRERAARKQEKQEIRMAAAMDSLLAVTNGCTEKSKTTTEALLSQVKVPTNTEVDDKVKQALLKIDAVEDAHKAEIQRKLKEAEELEASISELIGVDPDAPSKEQVRAQEALQRLKMERDSQLALAQLHIQNVESETEAISTLKKEDKYETAIFRDTMEALKEANIFEAECAIEEERQGQLQRLKEKKATQIALAEYHLKNLEAETQQIQKQVAAQAAATVKERENAMNAKRAERVVMARRREAEWQQRKEERDGRERRFQAQLARAKSGGSSAAAATAAATASAPATPPVAPPAAVAAVTARENKENLATQTPIKAFVTHKKPHACPGLCRDGSKSRKRAGRTDQTAVNSRVRPGLSRDGPKSRVKTATKAGSTRARLDGGDADTSQESRYLQEAEEWATKRRLNRSNLLEKAR